MDVEKSARDGAKPREVLAFRLGREEYALDVDWVQEIRGYAEATKLPNAPAHLLGVSNLRGAIVPLVDLRLGLGVGQATYDEATAAIILSRGGRAVGIVVDGVSDVLDLAENEILPAPQVEATARAHAAGIAPVGDRLLILLDIAGALDALGMDGFGSSGLA